LLRAFFFFSRTVKTTNPSSKIKIHHSFTSKTKTQGVDGKKEARCKIDNIINISITLYYFITNNQRWNRTIITNRKRKMSTTLNSGTSKMKLNRHHKRQRR
jgi:hypothetical protein